MTKLVDKLIDFLHDGSVIVLKRGEVVVLVLSVDHVSGILFVLVDGETELDELVDAASELGGLVKGEAGGEQRGLVQEPDKVLDGAVVAILAELVLSSTTMECLGFNSMVFLETM